MITNIQYFENNIFFNIYYHIRTLYFDTFLDVRSIKVEFLKRFDALLP